MHGKRDNQKMKPYLIYRLLYRLTDENNVLSASDLITELEDLGIEAERRSIYSDIDAINKVLWLLENDSDIDEAADAIDNDDDNFEKAIIYDAAKKGFYLQRRDFELDDIRIIAECINSARFITDNQAKDLISTVCQFVSDYQGDQIQADAFVFNRSKTKSTSVINNISIINDAMSTKLNGERHTPEKISFQYLKYDINDLSKQVERRKGLKYIVSPYKLLINDGNYYLLAFDDAAQDMRTYRLDRMKRVSRIGEERDGGKEFANLDLHTYTQRVFSMFNGQEKVVQIRFVNKLLDTVIDRFGTENISYVKDDKSHFVVMTKIQISDAFFSWLCTFGKMAKIIEPQEVIDDFKQYLDKIRNMY